MPKFEYTIPDTINGYLNAHDLHLLCNILIDYLGVVEYISRGYSVETVKYLNKKLLRILTEIDIPTPPQTEE